MDCCSLIELTSSNSDETFKALGLYTLKQGSIIENRPVYVEEESGSHLLFGLDGWKVIPSTPEDNDPPLVSFIHCKPPRESVCPDRCVNDGNWTFFSQAEGKDLPDTEKFLSLSCFNSEKGFNVTWIVWIGLLFIGVMALVLVLTKNIKVVKQYALIVKRQIITLTKYVSNNQIDNNIKNVGATPVKKPLDVEKSQKTNDNENCELMNKKDILNLTLENTKDPHDEFLETPRKRVTPRIREIPIKRTSRKVNNNASKRLFESI